MKEQQKRQAAQRAAHPQCQSQAFAPMNKRTDEIRKHYQSGDVAYDRQQVEYIRNHCKHSFLAFEDSSVVELNPRDQAASCLRERNYGRNLMLDCYGKMSHCAFRGTATPYYIHVTKTVCRKPTNSFVG